jgi:hypothetical protein
MITAGEVRLLLDLVNARVKRGPVEQAGERVEHGAVAMLELALHERGHHRRDREQQGQRRDQAGGVVGHALGIDPDGHAEHHRGGNPRERDHDRRPETRSGVRHRKDHPREGRARLAAAHPDRDSQERQDHQVGVGRDQLRAVGPGEAPLHGAEHGRRDSEQEQEPPAQERRGGHDRDSARQPGQRAGLAHALACLECTSAVLLRRT